MQIYGLHLKRRISKRVFISLLELGNLCYKELRADVGCARLRAPAARVQELYSDLVWPRASCAPPPPCEFCAHSDETSAAHEKVKESRSPLESGPHALMTLFPRLCETNVDK